MSVLNYVPRLPLCFTCLRALSAYVLFVLTCLTCLRAFASSVSSFFDVPYVPSFFYVLIFSIFYVYICLSGSHKSMKNFPSLSSIFTSIKLMLQEFFVFLKRKMLITFNAEENSWAFGRLEHESVPIKRSKKKFIRLFA